ncbi:MAG: TldD/PmbA family protein [Polyangiaceae bacterium]
METDLDEAIEAALAHLKKSADVRYAEVRFVEETGERLRVRDGRPENVSSSESRGVGVRVLARAWGFASTPDCSEAGIVRATERALAVARASGRVAQAPVSFPEREASRGMYETGFDIDPFTVPIEEKLAELEKPVAALLAGGKPIQSAEAWMDWTRVSKRLVTTEGTDTTQSFTYGACGMQVTAVDDAGSSQRRSYPTNEGSEGFQGGYERVRALDLMGHVAEVREEAIALLTAPPCPEGKRDLIVESSQMALQIHESCGHPTELDRALGTEISLAGGSFLQPSMLGKLRYGSKLVDLVADATSEGGMGTFGWDDEGVSAGKHALVREGVFVDYLSSRETAAALGRESTGTMRADGWSRLPLIRMINVSLEPRKGTLEDLVADTKDGVLVSTNKSWSIDDIRLNFQFSCEIAWEIKGGKRTRILRDPRYTGITPSFWGGCEAICGRSDWRLWGINNCGKGDPMQLMQVGHGAAPALFRGVTVGNAGRSA